LGKCNTRFSLQAAFLRTPTGEEKSIFAVFTELAETGKFVNLTKDIGKQIFFHICGNKPGVVWNMAAGRQRNGESLRFGLPDFFLFLFF
jgi:hypothetical protein